MFYLLVKVSFASSPPSKLKIAVLFCSIYKKDNFVQCTSFLSDFHPMANDDYVT